MDEVKFSCTLCRSSLSASSGDIGELIQCPVCKNTLKVPPYGITKGMKIGDFIIKKCLGVGGMGEVWLATQESLQRQVALKILSPKISNDTTFVQRFKQEVKIAGQLIHPNIVIAFHAGEDSGIHYLSTAYIKGVTASELLTKQGYLPELKVLHIGREIAKALKYAWEHSHILHRDVKPDNIMIADTGVPMLMDMGISKNFDEDLSLTMTGEIIGTPNYISPEQAHSDKNIDSRADQYSLGATMFHMLTGTLPYQATSAMGILSKHLQAPVPDARKNNPLISKECAGMITTMMAKSPEDRYQSWSDFITAVNLLLPPELQEIPPNSPDKKEKENKHNSKLPALLIIVIILVLSITTILSGKIYYNTLPSDHTITLNQRPSDNIDTVKTPHSDLKQQNLQKNRAVTQNIPGWRRGNKSGDEATKPYYSLREQRIQRLQNDLNLSEDQTRKISDELKKYQQKQKFIRTSQESGQQTPSSREKMRDEWEQLLVKVEKIIGPSKMDAFKDFIRQTHPQQPSSGNTFKRREF